MKNKNKIKIKINGRLVRIKPNSSVNELILKLKVPLSKVAIELNKKILDKKKLKKIQLKSNDNIEIVHFIGGG